MEACVSLLIITQLAPGAACEAERLSAQQGYSSRAAPLHSGHCILVQGVDSCLETMRAQPHSSAAHSLPYPQQEPGTVSRVTRPAAHLQGCADHCGEVLHVRRLARRMQLLHLRGHCSGQLPVACVRGRGAAAGRRPPKEASAVLPQGGNARVQAWQVNGGFADISAVGAAANCLAAPTAHATPGAGWRPSCSARRPGASGAAWRLPRDAEAPVPPRERTAGNICVDWRRTRWQSASQRRLPMALAAGGK
mmetsp:Transcript_54687/g.175406  ORF Transcript_54687/g.175406 Transcript_54687/m.175406 type:complete len:250 (+) Transcript_54687:635-1384(+)